MIQRIQTIFLAVAAIAMVAFLFLPIWTKISITTNERATLDAFNLIYAKGTLSQVTPVYYLAVMAVISTIIAVFAIFQFKNRVKQMLFVALNSLVAAALMVTTVYLAQYDASKLFAPDIHGEYKIGIFAVGLGLLCNGLANRAIRRDERMVKNADRMR